MASKEFKDLVAAVKKAGGHAYDVPFNILIDKETGEPKPSAKNLQAYELAMLAGKLSDAEVRALSVIGTHYAKNTPEEIAIKDYVKSEIKGDPYFYTFRNLRDLYRDVTKKRSEIQKKKEREAKKNAVATAKAQVTASLNRKDVAATVSKILKGMEPYIVKGEKQIKDTFEKKDKEFQKDWKETLDYMKAQKVVVTRGARHIESGRADDMLRYGDVRDGNGKEMDFTEFVVNNRLPLRNWVDHKWQPIKSLSWFASGKTSEFIQTAQQAFRRGELDKVNILFFRLFKSNPTLQNYTLVGSYDGGEFTLEANNEKGEKIVIQTNTITAGGYNIQRLHTRWLVSVRNTVSGKTEKFTIDDKDKA